ncbi:MAG: MraY family glycosyltransferase [Pseudomonadota bacterium]
MILGMVASFALAYVVCWLLVVRGTAGWAVDVPNARSLHHGAIPRVGGGAMALGAAAGWWLSQSGEAFWLLPTLGLFVVSLLDDLCRLPVAPRLVAHITAAIGFVLLGFHDIPVMLGVGLVLILVWMTNLYNFMDGADGLAGGMACVGFGVFAYAAHSDGYTNLASANGVVASAALGFLLHNYPPARLFMGDMGAIPLGFLAGAMGIIGCHQGAWSPWFPLMVFSPFLVDASVTLIKRGLQGEPIWQAHKEHYYQRVIRLGVGRRRMLSQAYGIMAIAAGLGLICEARPEWRMPCMVGWLAALGYLMRRIDMAWKVHQAGRGN